MRLLLSCICCSSSACSLLLWPAPHPAEPASCLLPELLINSQPEWTLPRQNSRLHEPAALPHSLQLLCLQPAVVVCPTPSGTCTFACQLSLLSPTPSKDGHLLSRTAVCMDCCSLAASAFFSPAHSKDGRFLSRATVCMGCCFLPVAMACPTTCKLLAS